MVSLWDSWTPEWEKFADAMEERMAVGGHYQTTKERGMKYMPPRPPSPSERKRRMARMFAKDYSVLADDYEYFTRTGAHATDGAPTGKQPTRGVATLPSTGPRKSAARRAPRSRARS